MSEKSNASTVTGCLGAILALPAACIWYVMFGMMLHATHAETWQWALYVGYLVLHFLGMVVIHFARMLSNEGA